MHSARIRSSRSALSSAFSSAISSSAAGEDMQRLSATPGRASRAQGDECALVLLADAGVVCMSYADDRPLPDCLHPAPAVMLWPMFKRLFPALVLASASLAACTRVETAAGPPALPQVTAAAAVSRPVTEWDEFTGRLEPVQSVGVRPRVSGLISSVTFEEG